MSVVKDRDFLSVTMAQLSVGKVDNAIHWLHLYPVDNAIGDLHDDVFWLLRLEFFRFCFLVQIRVIGI